MDEGERGGLGLPPEGGQAEAGIGEVGVSERGVRAEGTGKLIGALVAAAVRG